MNETNTTTGKTAARTGRGVKIALGLSLAVNLLILGMIGGAVLNGRPAGGPGERIDIARTLALGPMGRALERGDRNAIIERVGQDREELRGHRADLLEATLAFARAVRAEPFDREAAEAALEMQRGQVVALQARGHGALLDQLETMPAAERAAFSERLVEALDRHRPGPDRR